MLAGAILSGGASRRMGSPKALLPFHGRSFLEHMLENLQHPRIGVRRVVLGADAGLILSAIQMRAEEIVVNLDWEQGQLSSIHAAIRSLPPETDGLLLWPIDHPLVPAALIDQLIECFYSSSKAIIVPKYQGRRGHPVIFSSALYGELLMAPMKVGARAVVWSHARNVEEVSTNAEGCVLNLNDVETMSKAIRDES